MTVRGQQKAILRKENLPAPSILNDGTYGYVVRYRVISEDQNRFSAWSPVYVVRPQYVFVRQNSKEIDQFVIEPNLGYVNIIWDPVDVYDQDNQNVVNTATEYDVWIKWGIDGDGTWRYRERVSGNSLILSIPPEYNDTASSTVSLTPEEISVEIYMPGSPASRSTTNLLVYKKDNASL
jgi:hypothetical protein